MGCGVNLEDGCQWVRDQVQDRSRDWKLTVPRRRDEDGRRGQVGDGFIAQEEDTRSDMPDKIIYSKGFLHPHIAPQLFEIASTTL